MGSRTSSALPATPSGPDGDEPPGAGAVREEAGDARARARGAGAAVLEVQRREPLLPRRGVEVGLHPEAPAAGGGEAQPQPALGRGRPALDVRREPAGAVLGVEPRERSRRGRATPPSSASSGGLEPADPGVVEVRAHEDGARRDGDVHDAARELARDGLAGEVEADRARRQDERLLGDVVVDVRLEGGHVGPQPARAAARGQLVAEARLRARARSTGRPVLTAAASAVVPTVAPRPSTSRFETS